MLYSQKNRQESNDKPGSVRAGARDRHSSRRAVACPLKQPTRKVWPGQPPSLFGLAPDGVCRACRVTTASGGLLLHRFTLTRPVRDRPGGLLSVALSEGRPSWTLSSVLPCGARTFLTWHLSACQPRTPALPACYSIARGIFPCKYRFPLSHYFSPKFLDGQPDFHYHKTKYAASGSIRIKGGT